jgi:hypothetical protein
MIELHPNNSYQVAGDSISRTQRVTEDSELHPVERESEKAPRPNKSPHLNWEMLAIWSFVVFSFAAFIFAGYVIWAKCQIR